MSKILVTDGRYSHTLGIIRSLAKLGHEVDCIGHPLCLSSFSKSTNKCSYKQSLFTEKFIDDFLLFLDNKKYDFLIPIGARSIHLVNKFRTEIEKKTIINLAPKKSIEICLDKKKLLTVAEKLGIPVPKTYNEDEVNALTNSRENFNKRLVVKPSSELSDDKVIYLSKIDYKNKNIFFDVNKYLIQDYIQGEGYGFFAIYENGHLKEFFMHRRIRENPITGGSSVCAQSIYDPKLYSYGTDLLNKLNWHGVAMVEFKKDLKSGRYFLMEVNPKFWGSHDLAIVSGINFAEKYIEINQNNKSYRYKKNINPNYIINKSFQWLARDIKTNLFRPKRLLNVFNYLFFLRASNNLYIRDPLPSLYLVTYAFLSPLVKLKIVKEIYSFFYKIKSYGFKTAIIRTYTEKLGLPILKFSLINFHIALGPQPSRLGLNYLRKKGFRYILNVRSEFNYNNFIADNFYLKHIPVDEYSNPSLKNLNDGADYINYVITKNAKIYIHCREGISRAACFVMAYLIKHRGLSYQKAFNKIKKQRYFINILKNQVVAIKDFEREINGSL